MSPLQGSETDRCPFATNCTKAIGQVPCLPRASCKRLCAIAWLMAFSSDQAFVAREPTAPDPDERVFLRNDIGTSVVRWQSSVARYQYSKFRAQMALRALSATLYYSTNVPHCCMAGESFNVGEGMEGSFCTVMGDCIIFQGKIE